MWDDLPEDIMVRILLNLPVEDVIRCSSLKKSCHSLVYSNFFVHSYNQHSHLHRINPPLIILQFLHRTMHTPKLSLRHYHAEIDEYTPLESPFDPWLSISNCCNGLVCLYDCYDSSPFILWNPHIRKTLTLPLPNFGLGFSAFLGLGFVDETSDYKVLMVDERRQAELYSLHHNSWKIIAHSGPGNIVRVRYYTSEEHTGYVKGSLYCIRSMFGKLVLGIFDFKDEVFSDTSLPDGWDFDYFIADLHLRVHAESSIAAVRRQRVPETRSDVFHIHVMDVNEKKWSKYWVVSSPCCPVRNILGFNNEGEEIVEWHQEYDEDENKTNRIGIHRNGKWTTVIEHANCIGISVSYGSNLALLDIAEQKL